MEYAAYIANHASRYIAYAAIANDVINLTCNWFWQPILQKPDYGINGNPGFVF